MIISFYFLIRVPKPKATLILKRMKYLLMKSNKSNSNNDYFIEKWCGVHLRFGVLEHPQ